MEASVAARPRTALVAVLAGGLARRMGGAKAGALLCGRPLISYPLAAARAAGLDAVVVAKRASELPALAARVVYEPDEPRHPLCGIVAALRHARAPVVAVGCDMPFVSAELLARLARGVEAQAADGAGGAASTAAAPRRTAAIESAGRLQPLPGVYEPGDLAALEAALAAERPLRATLAELAPAVIAGRELASLGSPERLCFSVNDERDLLAATRWMAG
jgi:molybdenum cofactor guanylyltransferase